MKYKYIFFSIVVSGYMSCNTGSQTSPEYIEALKMHRVEYKEDFKVNERAPLRTEEELSLMDFYDADQAYDLKCRFVKEEKNVPVVMSTYAGKTKDFIVYGRATCKVKNTEFTLALYQSALARMNPLAAGKLFLPFKDVTNGEETYGGGRYMDASVDDIYDNMIALDFNLSYNPWCAYSDGYNCPVPPVENHLPFKMEVGEKNYLGEVKH